MPSGREQGLHMLGLPHRQAAFAGGDGDVQTRLGGIESGHSAIEKSSGDFVPHW
jgi:hypothetical protein